MEKSERYRKWYEEHKEYKLIQIKLWQKKHHYSSDKFPHRKKITNIRRKTRYFFPLKNKRCEFCYNLAVEHHHYTQPIEIDKFWFVCHSCHLILNKLNRGGIKIQCLEEKRKIQ